MIVSTTPLAPKKRVSVLGLGVDPLTLDECVARIEGFVEEGTPHLVVTADSSGLVAAQTDPEFAEIVRTADLVTPDSFGVVWALRRKGVPNPERASGVDIVDRLCARSADTGHRLFFIGAAPGVAEQAAEKMRLKYPGCHIVGARHGYFPAESDEVVAQEVAVLKPDILFVAMGIPRQEKFIKKTMAIIGATAAMGVGGSFDVFSGNVKRAPKLIQKLKLEWLWRTILNPKKISKAKALPIFAWHILRGR